MTILRLNFRNQLWKPTFDIDRIKGEAIQLGVLVLMNNFSGSLPVTWFEMLFPLHTEQGQRPKKLCMNDIILTSCHEWNTNNSRVDLQ